MKETISIGKINGSEITAIKAEDGTVLVPIKPICAALGVDVESQRKKINEDEDLRSTAVLSTAVGADGKERSRTNIRSYQADLLHIGCGLQCSAHEDHRG